MPISRPAVAEYEALLDSDLGSGERAEAVWTHVGVGDLVMGTIAVTITGETLRRRETAPHETTATRSRATAPRA